MKKNSVRKIGIFGGTFNPPHVGHVIVAERVREILKLDRMYFVPSFISPHKNAGEEVLAAHRLKMVRLAVRHNEYSEASDIEVAGKETSYTYKTIEFFRQRFPGSKLFLIIGADNFIDFQTWKFPERIVSMSSLIVVNRPSHKISRSRSRFGAVAKFISVPDIQVSSTEIRNRVKQRKSIRYMVSPAVEEYIMDHKLYR